MNKTQKKMNDSIISGNVNGIEIAHYPLQAYFFYRIQFEINVCDCPPILSSLQFIG